MTKTFCGLCCAVLWVLPLSGCGGVETEPVGVPVVDDGMEGVDLSLEK